MAHDVFISYSLEDKAAADAACAVLENARIRCWMAPRDILPGGDWGASIVDAIDGCRAMVLIFSSSANGSPQIRNEVVRAVSKGVPIIPMRIENIEPTKTLAYYIGAVHWLEALTPPLEAHLKHLTASIEALLQIEPPAQLKAEKELPIDAPEPAPQVFFARAAPPRRDFARAPNFNSPLRPLSDGELLFLARSRRRPEWMATTQFERGRTLFAKRARSASPCPPEVLASRSSGGGSRWFLLTCAAAAVAGALFYRHEIGTFLGWLAKSLFHSSVAPMPAVASDGTVADVSVYAPPHVALGERFLVQVFAYDTDDDEDMIGAAATAVDLAAVKRGVATLDIEIAHGDRLDFTLDAPGLVIEDAQQRLIWRGKPRSCAFLVKVPDDFSGSATHMRVRVLRQAVPIGQISFSMRVTVMAAPGPNEPTGDSARRFRRAFLSYTSSDRAEVIKRAQALRAAHVDFFNDLLSLEPGERWEQKLYEEIERCDVFLLFWSHAARDSVWVNKEIDHALACLRQHGGARPEILPIILEGPPPPKPPDSLADRQFNDPLLYVIAAVDKLAAIRPAN